MSQMLRLNLITPGSPEAVWINPAHVVSVRSRGANYGGSVVRMVNNGPQGRDLDVQEEATDIITLLEKYS